jgi:hypothetical protein
MLRLLTTLAVFAITVQFNLAEAGEVSFFSLPKERQAAVCENLESNKADYVEKFNAFKAEQKAEDLAEKMRVEEGFAAFTKAHNWSPAELGRSIISQQLNLGLSRKAKSARDAAYAKLQNAVLNSPKCSIEDYGHVSQQFADDLDIECRIDPRIVPLRNEASWIAIERELSNVNVSIAGANAGLIVGTGPNEDAHIFNISLDGLKEEIRIETFISENFTDRKALDLTNIVRLRSESGETFEVTSRLNLATGAVDQRFGRAMRNTGFDFFLKSKLGFPSDIVRICDRMKRKSK